MLRNPADVAHLVKRWGMLPFFKGEVEGFSLEEQVQTEFWFPDSGEGVWEWKNEVMELAGCAYGKFYRGKACFVALECFAELANYRRSLHTTDKAGQELLDAVRRNGSLLSRDLKKMCGYTAPRRRLPTNPLERAVVSENTPKPKAKPGFEAAITRLQMDCRLLIADFEYSYTRQGERYGWSVARYCTPEEYFGPEVLATAHTPQQSRNILLRRLAQSLPQATPEQAERIVG
ncbi:MAG: hypothetical protein K5650_08335 [Bacteroidales bacterium]|nr:hypothetical protein [Bacteroidales bacterium]